MKDELCDNMIKVRSVSDRVMSVVVVDFEEDVLRLICVYALQSGRCFEGKQFL